MLSEPPPVLSCRKQRASQGSTESRPSTLLRITLTVKPSDQLPRVVSRSGYQGVCRLRDKQGQASASRQEEPSHHRYLSDARWQPFRGSVLASSFQNTQGIAFLSPSQTLGERCQGHWTFGNTHFGCVHVAVGVGFILTVGITVRPHLLDFHVTLSSSCWSVTPVSPLLSPASSPTVF